MLKSLNELAPNLTIYLHTHVTQYIFNSICFELKVFLTQFILNVKYI